MNAGNLSAVYAPPGPIGRAGAQPKTDWTAVGALKAALKVIQSAPFSTLLWLGILPNAWDLPATILNRRVQSETFALDWGVQLRELGADLAVCAWTALPLGGEALVGLDLTSHTRAGWRRFVEGLRFFPALFLASASLSIVARGLLAGGSVAEDSEPWILVSTLPLFCLLIYVFMVWSLVTYRLVDARRGLFDALRYGTGLIRRSPLRFFGLCCCTSLLQTPAFAAGLAGSPFLEAGAFAVVMPVVWLAWAQPYMASRSTSSELAPLGMVDADQ